MMSRLFALVSGALCLATCLSTAQDDTAADHRWSAEWSWPRVHGRPAISAYYGFTTSKFKGMGGSFSNPRLGELKMGTLAESTRDSGAGIRWYDFGYFDVTNISNDLGNKSAAGSINADLWRFGIGWDKGYGYGSDDASVVLYNSFGLLWSRLRIEDFYADSADSALLAPFDGTFRFGTKVEGGIKARIIPNLSIDAGYERDVVFPAHLFWKWLGSSLLEVGGQGVIDEFVGRILESSPGAAPVISFVLKSGFSYAFYELRKDKMNYPFESGPPLRHDSFKAGLTFVF